MANNNKLKEIFHSCKEWILNHSKIVLPVIVLVCVVITVVVALNANRKETEKQTVGAEPVTEEISTEMVVPEEPFEVNAYPDINNLIQSYYAALAEGNVEAVEALNSYVDDTEKIRIAEISKYIESYPVIEVYTKKGPAENSFLVYAYSHVKFFDYDNTVPGMQTFYICQREDGNYYINEGEEDDAVLEYIRTISLQDDVIDLNNKVNVEYNDLRASDSALSAFLAELDSQINISVGEILAAAEAESEQAQESAEGAEDDTEAAGGEEEVPQNTIQKARTTDVVNIRSSDSETADKLGKAQKGDTFTVLENKVNGWSRIEYEGREAYIRSDYLEVVSEETVPEVENNDTQEQQQAENSNNTEETDGYVTVKETVNIRSGQSETSDRVGVAYKGEKLELIMKLSDGWCKIKYDGETAYVKSDYVE